MDIILGVDFDNTIVNCSQLFHELAVQRKIIPAATAKDKQSVRHAVRKSKDGEIEWQRLQALVYGPGLQQARPVAGVIQALESCRERNVRIYIISHKSQYAAQDESSSDLRVQAMRWLKNNGLLALVNKQHVFFENSRADKIRRIKTMNCTHFVDDLIETFQEPNFGPDVTKLLFDPNGYAGVPKFVKPFHSWKNIVEYIFETAFSCQA